MGPGIIIPTVVLLVGVPLVLMWAKRRFRGSTEIDPLDTANPAVRLTSTALRTLASPPWRVVYEIAPDRLGGAEHVLLGPAGAFAVQTTLDPLPDTPEPDESDDRTATARAAITRGGLDDALRRCAMSVDGLVIVHWGATPDGAPPARPGRVHGTTAVDGRRLTEWLGSLPAGALSPAQVDLAWQTVVTAIGRPDPLA